VDEFGNAIAVRGIEQRRRKMLVGIGKGTKAHGISTQKFRLGVNRHVRSLSENITEH
jgi:hypothetical protein